MLLTSWYFFNLFCLTRLFLSWSQASELQRLVRDHFDSFVRCADSIEKYASHINIELSKNKEQVNSWLSVNPAYPSDGNPFS